MRVRFILVDLTVPDKMRPRIDTLPVNGHLWSMYEPAVSAKKGQGSDQQASSLFCLLLGSYVHGDPGMSQEAQSRCLNSSSCR